MVICYNQVSWVKNKKKISKNEVENFCNKIVICYWKKQNILIHSISADPGLFSLNETSCDLQCLHWSLLSIPSSMDANSCQDIELKKGKQFSVWTTTYSSFNSLRWDWRNAKSDDLTRSFVSNTLPPLFSSFMTKNISRNLMRKMEKKSDTFLGFLYTVLSVRWIFKTLCLSVLWSTLTKYGLSLRERECACRPCNSLVRVWVDAWLLKGRECVHVSVKLRAEYPEGTTCFSRSSSLECLDWKRSAIAGRTSSSMQLLSWAMLLA